MPSDFLQGIQTGATVGNLMAQRQERMMELRSQEALRQIQERQIANEASLVDQRSQLIQQQVAQAQKDQADTQANAIQWQSDIKTGKYTPDQADDVAIRRMLMINPTLGEKQAKSLLELRKSKLEGQQFTPQVVQPTDTTTGQPAVDEMGRPIKAMTTGRGQAVAIDKEPTQVSLIKHFVDEHNKAKEAGNNDLAEALRGGLSKATTGTGFTLQTNPDGTLTFTQGQLGSPDALTKSNQTKVQEQQAQALTTVDTAQRLIPLLNEQTMGTEAWARSIVQDRILAQRFPEMASGQRAEASQLINQLRASTVKSLRSDGNISEGERKEILGSFPKANDPIDSAARARMVVQQVQTMAAIQALVATKKLGGEVPKSAALALDDEAVADMVKRGVINSDLAQKIWKLKRK